jgi:hypothetical protein
MNKKFLFLNLLFIPYYFKPLTFSYNISLNISSSLYWYNQCSNYKNLFLLFDRVCIIYGMYNSFILAYSLDVKFCILSCAVSSVTIYIHHLSKITKDINVSNKLHSLMHLYYHIINYYLFFSMIV